MRVEDLVANNQLALTAYHEAAHAVAYVHFGQPFRYVTIRARDAVGQVHVGRPRQRDWLELGIITAAGPAAERYLVPDLFGSAESYLEEAEEYLEDWGDGGGDGEQLVTMFRDRDTQLGIWKLAEEVVIRHNWSKVDAVAKSLLASPRALTCAEVKAVMGPVKPLDLSDF